MKICSSCKEIKSLLAFGKHAASNDGLMTACKACRRAHDKKIYAESPTRREALAVHQKANYLRNRKFLRAYLETHPCVDCGQSDTDLLEFDHVRGKKTDNIASMARGNSIKKIEEEIVKCEVRCLYCHRKKTIKEFGWYAYLV